ncbi:urease accessory protein UreE [sulfur-oxidizing endosymbiont of Gigantopelta aegis]|uniref:urease accessory protein UreE n=1 Tax=sulfur-oxidizing endosymbiont of Gigantopelta aegis TaxID=2794934 RepID=UPI0018DB5F50|nr:urease accessory protein UreE [sulfur-oxidizing endosymbiont of Gigantopelta aegis]
MLKITEKLAEPKAATANLKLPFELRQKSRLKVTLDDGRQAGLFLQRGEVLRGGDCLQAEDGSIIQIQADNETVSLVQCDNALLLARACYHLGNRHVPLQISSNSLSYLHDHVLDDMLKQLGLNVSTAQAPFEPESGAYGGHSHSHSHD